MKIKAALIVFVLAFGALSMAQVDGGGRPGGGGGGRGGMRMGMNQPGGGPASILRRPDVQAELKLTDKQKEQISDIQQAQREVMREAMQGGGQPDRALMEKTNKEAEKQMLALLDDGQKKRLREVWIQIAGINAILDAKVQEDLGFTAEQKKQVKDLNEAQRKEQESAMQAMRDGTMDRQTLQDSMGKAREKFKADLEKIPTAEQKAKLKEMGGKEFKQTDPGQGRGRGPGGPGGGGGGGN